MSTPLFVVTTGIFYGDVGNKSHIWQHYKSITKETLYTQCGGKKKVQSVAFKLNLHIKLSELEKFSADYI